MTYRTLVATQQLAEHLDEAGWVVFDCRHDLARPEAGEAEHARSHVPGARFLHLDRDLAGPRSGSNGRHPLPSPDALAEKLSNAGVSNDTQVVAYDASGGMYAARLWFLLRWLGHEAVAVLDGGWDAWVAEGRPVQSEPTVPVAKRGRFEVRYRPLDISVQAVLANRAQPLKSRAMLVDARAPDRFRGENETLDPVGGRIPGASHRFFRDNLDAAGRFKAPAQLNNEWQQLLGANPAENIVHYCGSGVSACHNVLAMEIAGLSGSRLYAGSWSEWCADPARPVARGEPPPLSSAS